MTGGGQQINLQVCSRVARQKPTPGPRSTSMMYGVFLSSENVGLASCSADTGVDNSGILRSSICTSNSAAVAVSAAICICISPRRAGSRNCTALVCSRSPRPSPRARTRGCPCTCANAAAQRKRPDHLSAATLLGTQQLAHSMWPATPEPQHKFTSHVCTQHHREATTRSAISLTGGRKARGGGLHNGASILGRAWKKMSSIQSEAMYPAVFAAASPATDGSC